MKVKVSTKVIIINEKTRELLKIWEEVLARANITNANHAHLIPTLNATRNDLNLLKEKGLAIIEAFTKEAHGLKYRILASQDYPLEKHTFDVVDCYKDYLDEATSKQKLKLSDADKPEVSNHFILLRELLIRLVAQALSSNNEPKANETNCNMYLSALMDFCSALLNTNLLFNEGFFSKNTLICDEVTEFARTMSERQQWLSIFKNILNYSNFTSKVKHAADACSVYFNRVSLRIEQHLLVELKQRDLKSNELSIDHIHTRLKKVTQKYLASSKRKHNKESEVIPADLKHLTLDQVCIVEQIDPNEKSKLFPEMSKRKKLIKLFSLLNKNKKYIHIFDEFNELIKLTAWALILFRFFDLNSFRSIIIKHHDKLQLILSQYDPVILSGPLGRSLIISDIFGDNELNDLAANANDYICCLSKPMMTEKIKQLIANSIEKLRNYERESGLKLVNLSHLPSELRKELESVKPELKSKINKEKVLISKSTKPNADQYESFFQCMAKAISDFDSTSHFTANDLRGICNQYYSNPKEHQKRSEKLKKWLNDLFIKYPQFVDFKAKNEAEYYSNIYSANERDKSLIPIVGHPFIEGRILCRMHERKHNYTGIYLKNIFVTFYTDEGHKKTFLITAKKIKSVGDHYYAEKSVYLNYRNGLYQKFEVKKPEKKLKPTIPSLNLPSKKDPEANKLPIDVPPAPPSQREMPENKPHPVTKLTVPVISPSSVSLPSSAAQFKKTFGPFTYLKEPGKAVVRMPLPSPAAKEVVSSVQNVFDQVKSFLPFNPPPRPLPKPPHLKKPAEKPPLMIENPKPESPSIEPIVAPQQTILFDAESFAENSQSVGILYKNNTLYTIKIGFKGQIQQDNNTASNIPVLYLLAKDKIYQGCSLYTYLHNLNGIKPDGVSADWNPYQGYACRFTDPVQIVNVIDSLCDLGLLKASKETDRILLIRNYISPSTFLLPLRTDKDFSFLRIKNGNSISILLSDINNSNKYMDDKGIAEKMDFYGLTPADYKILPANYNVMQNLSNIKPHWIELKDQETIKFFLRKMILLGYLNPKSRSTIRALKTFWPEMLQKELPDHFVAAPAENYEPIIANLQKDISSLAFDALKSGNVDLLHVLVGDGLENESPNIEMQKKRLAEINQERIKNLMFSNGAEIILSVLKENRSNELPMAEIIWRLQNVTAKILAHSLHEFETESGDYWLLSGADKPVYIWCADRYYQILNQFLTFQIGEIIKKLQNLTKVKGNVVTAQRYFEAVSMAAGAAVANAGERLKVMNVLSSIKQREARIQKILHPYGKRMLPERLNSTPQAVCHEFLRKTKIKIDELEVMRDRQGLSLLESAIATNNIMAIACLLRAGMSIKNVNFAMIRRFSMSGNLLTQQELERIQITEVRPNMLTSEFQQEVREQLSHYEPELDTTRAWSASFWCGFLYDQNSLQERYCHTQALERSLHEASLSYSDKPVIDELNAQCQEYKTGILGRSRYHAFLNSVNNAYNEGSLSGFSVREALLSDRPDNPAVNRLRL